MEKKTICSAHSAFDAVSCVAHLSFYAVLNVGRVCGIKWQQVSQVQARTWLSVCAQRHFIIKSTWTGLPVQVFCIYFFSGISVVLSHTTFPWCLLEGFYLASPFWGGMGCLRDTEESPFVKIFKICPHMAHPDRWSWEVPLDLSCPTDHEKYRLADFHHFSSWSWSYSQAMKVTYIKTEVCP